MSDRERTVPGIAPGRCPYQPSGRTQPDPCIDYLHLRSDEPVRWDEDLGVWLVTGFHEATELLRHPGLSSAWPERGRTPLHASDTTRTSELVRRWFMFTDNPAHAEARSVVAPLFTAQSLARLRPFVEQTVDELLAPQREALDVVADLAVPLSSRVICRVIGLPQEVAPRLAVWAPDIAALLVADYLPEVVTRGHSALREVTTAVNQAFAGEVPEDSGLWLLREAQRRGEIAPEDVWATASLLIYAGFETTSTFIGKAVRAALHAGAWDAVREAEPRVSVDELLRFDTSVQQVARFATRPVVVAGKHIAPGDLVLVMLGVANRDPAVFEGPDLLDMDRRIGRHLTFGYGVHYCLGAALARLEAEVALERLAVRWSTMELSGAPTTRSHHGITVLEHLMVSRRTEGERI